MIQSTMNTTARPPDPRGWWRCAALLLVAVAACHPQVSPLPPPPAGQGFQLRTQARSVAPGVEMQDCYFFRVPADSDTFIKRIVLAQRIGSHHLNVFRVRTLVDLRGEDGAVVRGDDPTSPCWKSANWADWPLVANTQLSAADHPPVELSLPEGVAHRFAPRELLMVQTHFVNASTQQTPDVAEAWINFELLPKEQFKAELGTLFATNQNIQICPGESKFFEKVCRLPRAVTVFGANGHFHSRGRRFQMNVWSELSGKGALFYDSSSWDEPLMATGLAVPVPAQSGVSYRCEFQARSTDCGDPAKGCCFTFGPKVETNEHCNAFVYYYPKVDTDVPCF